MKLIIAWVDGSGKFDWLFVDSAYDVRLIVADKKIKVKYQSDRGDHEEVYEDSKYPGLSIDYGKRKLFYRNPREIQ